MNKRRKLATLVSLLGASSLILVACGGGGGGSSSAANDTGTVNVALTDGPGDDYDHVYVTVTKLAFHTDANQIWNKQDATWQTYTLPAPVTLDLASLNNGALNQVFNGLSLPVGTYRQIRLFLSAYDDALTASAQAAGLQWNDEVDYSDSTGTVHQVPLEIAYPVQGLQLNGAFNVVANQTLNLAIDFDLEHDVVKFKHGTEFYFTMKPNLRYFDLSKVGAVTGQIDPAELCAKPYTAIPQSGCGYNFVVKAELLSGDGSRHYVARATTLKPDGSFSLFPLPANGTNYDILIRGRNVETMLVKGVGVTAGSTPASGATQLSTSAQPITPVLSSGEYWADFATALNPTSGWAAFQQTLPGTGEVPYEVRWGNTNPYTGKLEVPMALENGPIQVATYASGSAPVFSPVVPAEGAGGFSVATNGIAYYTLSPNVPLASPGINTAANPLLFAENNPSLSAGVVQGTVSGTIQTTAGTYDRGYLVFSRFANIANVIDISGDLNSGSGGFQVSLPAGTTDNPVPGAYYYAYLRVWKSANPLGSGRIIPINGFADLRKTNSVSNFNVNF